MLEKVGFVCALIGVAGLAEAYGSIRSVIISLALIAVGAFLMGKGSIHETVRSRNIDSNVLDRLFFLRS